VGKITPRRGGLEWCTPRDLLVKQGSLLLAQQLRESYRPTETYGSAFAKLFARLFAEQGLILLEPLDAALHRIAAPLYRQAI